jgi:tetratricopeptide (TPR) repeat protein
MASLIPGYEYDIFISYRQKDNKYDGWVTEFVDNLKRELEATFKEEISVYFDINPHDGLLETHDVDASLKEKLKCLVFIPIISRTYCDPKSFAWEHEFIAFVEQASKDQFGLKVKLPNGNVANRVLPVRIHDLDQEDIKLCESVLGGVLRGVEFIYKEPGVNKPLTSEDDEKKNLNKTKYRIQINKIANAIKEIISGLMAGEIVSGNEKTEPQLPWEEIKKEERIIPAGKHAISKKRKLFPGIVSIVILALLVIVYAYPKIFKKNTLELLRSSGEKISIAVMPFQNLTNDTTWNVWQDGIQMSLISSLANTGELKVRQKDNINTLLKTKGVTEYAGFSPSVAGTISQQLEADIFIYGSIQKAGATLRVNAQLIDTKTKEVLNSFELTRPYKDDIIIDLSDSLRKKVTDFLLLSKLMKENPMYKTASFSTRSPEVLRYCIYGDKARQRGDYSLAKNWYSKALAIDSNDFDANLGLSFSGTIEENIKGLLKLYKKKDQMPIEQLTYTTFMYARYFESPNEQINYIKQILQFDDQTPSTYWALGSTYRELKQYDKAIPTFEKYLEMCQKFGFIDFSFYAAQGETYHKMGKFKEERKVYKRAERDIPDHSHITFSWIIRNQAILSLTEKDTVDANRYIAKYISFLKENSSSETEIENALAYVYDNAGMPDRAAKYYRKAISLEPENPALLNEFAYFLSGCNGSYAEFTSTIDKALKLAPSKWDYYNYLDTKGYGLFKLGRNQEARETLQNAWDSAEFKMYFIKSHLEEVKKAIAGQR